MPIKPDPDLEPVPAAKAAMAAMAEAEATRIAARRQRVGPAISRADPLAWETEVALQFPLLVDGERLDRVTLRMITGADIARLVMEEDQDHSLNVRARALVVGIHPDVFDALAGPDYERLAEAVRPFLPPSLVAADERIAEDLLDGVFSPED